VSAPASQPAIPQRVQSIAESYYYPYPASCAAGPITAAVQLQVADLQGPTPGATLAPNFVYQSTHPDGTPTMCFTETLGAGSAVDPSCSGANSVVACTQRSGVCTDALARGLLGPLTPLLSGGNDSVFQY